MGKRPGTRPQASASHAASRSLSASLARVLQGEVATSGPTCACRTPPGRGSAGSLAVMIRTLHLEAWAGLWVAVDHVDRVVASAPTVKDLMATLDGDGIEDVEIMRAPDPNEAIPYGLG